LEEAFQNVVVRRVRLPVLLVSFRNGNSELELEEIEYCCVLLIFYLRAGFLTWDK